MCRFYPAKPEVWPYIHSLLRLVDLRTIYTAKADFGFVPNRRLQLSLEQESEREALQREEALQRSQLSPFLVFAVDEVVSRVMVVQAEAFARAAWGPVWGFLQEIHDRQVLTRTLQTEHILLLEQGARALIGHAAEEWYVLSPRAVGTEEGVLV